MSNYLNRQNLLKELAKSHPDIRHEEVMESGIARKGFYKNMSDLKSTNINGPEYTGPCVVFNGYSARLADKGGSLRIKNINEWLILDRVIIDNNNPSITAAEDDVTDRMEKITIDFVNALINNYEEDQGCGWFKGLDLNSFQWVKEGPVADKFYGWKLTFLDETLKPETPANYWLEAPG